MTSLSHVLKSVASLISQRDSDLLDLSLVKTIFTFANISDALTIKVNRAGNAISVVKFESGACQRVEPNDSVDAVIMDAILHVRQLGREEYAVGDNGNYLNIFHLANTRGTDSYLVVRSLEVFSSQQQLVMQGFAQIYKNYFALLADSQRDQLTGLPNRKTFDDYIIKRRNMTDVMSFEETGSKRTGDITWLVIIDIDDFKKINDNFGHIYGDEVLIHVSEVLLASIRDNDFVFRFGGEEFVVIINADDQDSCKVAVERIRENVSKKIFSNVGSVTVSLGVAQFNPSDFYLTIIDNADKALYKSKKSGKNKAVFYDELVKSGEVTQTNIQYGDVDLF